MARSELLPYTWLPSRKAVSWFTCRDEARSSSLGLHLLPALQPLEEDTGGPGSTGGTAPSELYTLTSAQPRVAIPRSHDGEAGGFSGAGGATGLPTPEGLTRHRLYGVVYVVIQPLAPLHHHVAQLRVLSHSPARDQAAGHQPGIWLCEAIVQSERNQDSLS